MTRAEIVERIRHESSSIATFSARLQKLLERASESEAGDLASHLKIAGDVRNAVGLASQAIQEIEIAARKAAS